MSNQPNYTEMIDAYLTGRLSPEESSRLMQSLEQDPALKEEFLLQKDLVSSIQAHRRSELKARLNNIEVGTGYSLPSGSAFSSGAVKMLAGAAALVLLGTGAYFAFDSSEDTSRNQQSQNLPVTENIGQDTEITKEKVPAEENFPAVSEEEPAVVAKDTPEEAPKEAEKEKAGPKSGAVATSTGAKETSRQQADQNRDLPETPEELEENPQETAAAEVVKPDVISSFEEKDALGNIPEADAPEDKLNRAGSFETQNIEVTTKKDLRYPFHYMFFDNQLHIYGDFSEVPYEVLEVNTGRSTSYYLYHNGSYYELNPKQDKISRLRELKNEMIIKELEITRSEKLKR